MNRCVGVTGYCEGSDGACFGVRRLWEGQGRIVLGG